ncbi:TATA box-binding protein-associated factor, RNA polymerase I, subunit C [Solea solea]|uniref:TATA box-binding protein-associated factor, RNA polymerase I, subunit C n=1 Tax=Solea solea TaxID=90069 RepID=UPI002729CFAA|nr:TATA box-binding protein-associated factor, RNA polymerase I, subunit C [Solea solea]
MDYKFPDQLFPSFYERGPPDKVLNHCAGNWGSYDKLTIQDDSGSRSNWTFTSRHQVKGETWRHTEPVPLPLLSPLNEFLWPTKPPNPLDFMDHMQNFFLDHRHDAFGCMSQILGENFNFTQGTKEKRHKDSISMWRVTRYLDGLSFKKCRLRDRSVPLNRYSALLGDVVHAIPPQLLGSLLYEELAEQGERLLFSEAATGGALEFIPFSHNGDGYLVYPGNQGLNRLKFHRVELQRHRGSHSVLRSSSSDSFSFHLNGPIRQISSASLFNNSCVAVRSDYLCGVWRFSGGGEQPRLLQAVNTTEVATCVTASPHVLGEVLVASESGVVNLWTVGRGMQKVRGEDGNLYFNAESPWRWCDFSAHPRVMVYADRTGAELTDIRVSPVSARSLFSISRSSDCHRGERLVLSRYLRDVHSFHHLVTTQFSSYIVDERFPGVPVLKWDHMMESPPLFCHVLPGSASSGSVVGGAGTTKVVLGSQRSQELVLLQYSGGGATACSSRGPPLALLRPSTSLKHLPVQIPHRLDVATHRLSSSAAGLTCVQRTGGEGVEDECICVLQLTEAGDVFYQILEPQQQQIHIPDVEPQPMPSKPVASSSPSSQLFTENDVIGTTQKERQTFADSDESEDGGQRRRRLKQLKLQVVVNQPDEDEDDDDDDDEDDDPGTQEKDGEQSDSTEKEALCSSMSVVNISEDALVTWKRWLQKLMKKSRKKKKKPRPPGSQLFTADTEGFLRLRRKETREDKHVRSLRRDLRTCMSKRSLLAFSAPTLQPLPQAVDTDTWTDPLSRRLTISWQGEAAWRAWWEEELGLNRAEKEMALRRKRTREKERKRAAGRLELSGSFTSSTTYQAELDSFSDSAGWTSGSQCAWSDTDGLEDTVGGITPVPTTTVSPLKTVEGEYEPQTPSRSHDVSVSQTPSRSHDVSVSQTPNRSRDVSVSQTPSRSHDVSVWQTPNRSRNVSVSQTPSRSRDVSVSQTPNRSCDVSVSQMNDTPAARRASVRPAEGDHTSVLASQVKPLLSHHNVVEDNSGVRSPQSVSQQSVPQRDVRVNLSLDSAVWSGFFQSRPLSQSSRGHVGLSQSSQSSQAKKKKPRMGF